MEESERSSDRGLIERFRAGDREAFTILYRAHFPGVYRFAWHMTGDRVRAGEIAQDVFVWLVHHPGEFDADRGHLGAFLAGVARKFLLRQQRSDRRWLPFDEQSAPREGRYERNFDEDLERDRESARLRQAVAALPERYREAVVLCDLQSKSYEEAAAALGCAMGTVRSRLHRARELLARKFQAGSPKREGQRCL